MQSNSLYFGDNFKVLSERLPDGTYRFPSESVDLVYLDPPFNSNRNYNLIFKETSGLEADAQIQAFEDTWHWDATARDMLSWLTAEGVNEGRVPDDVARILDALVRGIGRNDMSAYLVMMTPRLLELRRVLKGTGTLWLHCDPTASHYLKLILDAIFGPERFVNEVIWKRSTAHSDSAQGSKHLGRLHDVVLLYSKSEQYAWNEQYADLSESYIKSHYSRIEPGTGRRYRLDNLTGPGGAAKGNPSYEVMGVTRFWRYSQERMAALIEQGRVVQTRPGGVPQYKRYLDETMGRPLQDIWDDIAPVNSQARERLGYPTQKPLALLERILNIASQEGDLVLDPFCGCGTALIAAEKLKRKWIGIDITHLSIAVMRARLMDSFALADVPVLGVPEDIESARMLAAESRDGRYEFQWWALARIDAKPLGGERKKGPDRGIDGVMTFSEHDSIKRILVSVKSGKPNVLHVRELIATLADQDGAVGILIELDPPTDEMKLLAVNAGQYESELWGAKFDRIQILTVSELLAGKKPNVPKFMPAYQKAARIAAEAGQQQALWEAAETRET